MELDKPKIKNIFLDAGGIYGYTLCGALQVLQNHNLLEHIENILCCSVGSILGLYLSLGFKIEEMTFLAFHINISKFVDFKNNNFLNIYQNFGFEKGTIFENVVKSIIKHKTGSTETTFLELYQKFKKNLIVIGGNVSTRRHDLFNYEKTPQMEVWKAIRISCSFPLVFQPFKYNNYYYVDGGNSHYNPTYFKNEYETIGIILEKSEPTNTEIKGFETFLLNMFYLPLKSSKFKDYNQDNCLEIDTNKLVINYMDLNLKYETKKKLYLLGFNEGMDNISNLLLKLQKIKKKTLKNTISKSRKKNKFK